MLAGGVLAAAGGVLVQVLCLLPSVPGSSLTAPGPALESLHQHGVPAEEGEAGLRWLFGRCGQRERWSPGRSLSDSGMDLGSSKKGFLLTFLGLPVIPRALLLGGPSLSPL